LYDKVSRIFAANLLPNAATADENRWTPSNVLDDVYLVTSDTDLWPISDSAYTLPDGVDVLSLNAFCCGTFQHRSQTYRMVPLANVGARLATWRNLTTHRWCQWRATVQKFGVELLRSCANVSLNILQSANLHQMK